MAKRKGRSNYGYDMVSISRRGLAIALGVVILLLGVAATVFCWGARDENGHWAKNPIITEWFDYWGKGAPIETEVTLEAGNPLAITAENSKSMPMTLSTTAFEENELAEQANAQNSYTITATVKPAEAFPNAVVWSSDHPDDVTVTPFANNQFKATITCLRPFDNTVTITCKSKYNPKVSNSVEVDYLAPLSDIDFSTRFVYKFGSQSYQLSFTPFFGTGSIFGTAIIASSTIELAQDSYNGIKEVLGADFDINTGFGEGDILPSFASPYEAFGDTNFSRSQFNGAFANTNSSCNVKVGIQVNYIFNDKICATKFAEIEVPFDPTTIPTTDVSDIDFDNNHFVFGQ